MLPDAWKEGRVSGLRARNGLVVDLAWREGRLTAATVHSELAGTNRISYGGQTITWRRKKSDSVTLDGRLLVK